MNETHLPITGICLVAKAASVPTGYLCIRKSKSFYFLINKIFAKQMNFLST